MSNFGRKAAGQQSGGNSDYDSAAWNEWNKYLFECMPMKKVTKKGDKSTKIKTLVGKINYIFDCGLPVGDKAQYASKLEKPVDGEIYSEAEKERISEQKALGRDVDFEWIRAWDDTKKAMTDQRFETSQAQPVQEYGIAVDFYQYMVDYSKHPNSPEGSPEDLRPFRISLNGKWMQDMQKPINFHAKWNKETKQSAVSDKNLIYKICKAAGREQELINSEFDIGVAAEAVCNFKVSVNLTEKSEDKVFFNPSVSTPSALEDIEFDGEVVATVEQQMAKVEACDKFAPFTGILLTMPMEDYTDEVLGMVGNDPYAYVKRAELSHKTVLSGIKKDGEPWEFPVGIHLSDEQGEPLWEDKRPVLGDYEDTNFAKAYAKWKAKTSSDKHQTGSSTTPKQTPSESGKPADKVAEKEPEPVPTYNEPPMDFDDD